MNSTFSLREADEGQHRYRAITFSFFTVSFYSVKLWSPNHPQFSWQVAQIASFHLFNAFPFVLPNHCLLNANTSGSTVQDIIFFPIIGQSQERSRQTNDTFQKKFSELFSFFFALLRLIKSTKAGAPDTQLTKCISFFISTTVFSSANIIGKGFF